MRKFDSKFVMKATIKHMQQCIDISINKTMDRILEFKDDTSASTEIFNTLAMLHSMRKQLASFPIEPVEIIK